MAVLAAYLLLMLGTVLELAGWGFWGLDLLVGICFAGAAGCGGLGFLTATAPRQGLIATAVGTVALVLHVWLNLV